MYFIVPVQVCVSRRVCTGLTKFNRDKIVQITEVLLAESGNDSNLLIVFYVQIMPDDFVMQLHRF